MLAAPRQQPHPPQAASSHAPSACTHSPAPHWGGSTHQARPSMQHSLAGNLGRLSARCSWGLRRWRHGAKCSGGPRSSLRLAACSSGLALASAAMGVPPSSDGQGSSQPPGKRKWPLEFGSPLRRCTDVLLLLNGLLFVLDWGCKGMLGVWGAKINAYVAAGQWWRLITCHFLHTSAFHLLINCYSLSNVGPHVEALVGRQRFLAVCLGAGLAGAATSCLLTPAPSLGASAVVYGLAATLALYYWRHRDALGRRSTAVLQHLGMFAAINAACCLATPRIDLWGHVGGLLGGAAVSWLLGPALVRGQDGIVRDQPLLPIWAHKQYPPCMPGLGVQPA